MRMLKCYLTNDVSGRFVTAGEAAKSSGGIWTCASCGCVLYLLTGASEKPWFEHNQQTVAESVLMNCTHLDPEVKAEIRNRKLRHIIGGLDTSMVALDWYCVWCGSHYRGVKHCYRCQTGIYSTEEANWQRNYCCSTG